jgi:hypothetical protein
MNDADIRARELCLYIPVLNSLNLALTDRRDIPHTVGELRPREHAASL